jgi:parvulin-like peptidyl-prolyl isomerase
VLYLAARPNPNVSRVRARHILIPFQQGDPVSRARARDDVERILRQLEQDPERFDELAREYSDDAISASRGGDLGWVQKGEFEDEFESYVWTAPLNEISDPVRTRHGFHIIEVLDRYISEADRYELELKERAMQPTRGSGAPQEESAAP